MKLFYEEMRSGAFKSEALRSAKLSMRHSLSNPFYWGSFICEGDWNTVPTEASPRTSIPGDYWATPSASFPPTV